MIVQQQFILHSSWYQTNSTKNTPAAVVTTIAGTGFLRNNDGQALTEATFTNQNAIAVAPDGIIHVGESNGNNTIRLIKQMEK